MIWAAASVIVAFSPIRHKNHPLSENLYRRNAHIARIITLAIAFSTTALTIRYGCNPVLSMAVVTLTDVAVMMMIPKILEGAMLK